MVGKRPDRPANSTPATQRPNPTQRPNVTQRPVLSEGNRPPNPPNKNQGGGNHRRDDEPSPWLQHSLDQNPDPAPTASFVEYLRWMRSPDHEYKNPTKVEILQLAETQANYSDRLQQLTNRTKLIAGESNCFEVTCPWRLRVGGHRGPESILLPAFDALGIPYIPSSTLRGVARTQAIREVMQQKNIRWQAAEQEIVPYFGSLQAEDQDKSGKVIFFDAYPVPSLAGGLAMDIATNIWNWQDSIPTYNSPNPNPFFSLKETSFLIGLKLMTGCQEPQILERVKAWLIAGLAQGIGSQVNAGYGELVLKNKEESNSFFKVEFSLEGQLIHGSQQFTNLRTLYKRGKDGKLETDRNGKLKPLTSAAPEVRASAFKSMLRYWFRAFALSVLNIEQVKEQLELQLFGSIAPQTWGWVRVEIRDGETSVKSPQTEKQPCGIQQGTLVLSFSPAAPPNKHPAIQELFKNLTWMMFHLGGVGQGARRPCYARNNREKPKPPFYRGSTLFPADEDEFWQLPDRPQEFGRLFQQRLNAFYKALAELAGELLATRACGRVTTESWAEVVDSNCRIIVCTGSGEFDKPYALSVLHQKQFKQTNRKGELVYDPNLCGTTNQPVRPSPVWIADLGSYQVVTVFGATASPRSTYLAALRNAIQIFPPPDSEL